MASLVVVNKESELIYFEGAKAEIWNNGVFQMKLPDTVDTTHKLHKALQDVEWMFGVATVHGERSHLVGQMVTKSSLVADKLGRVIYWSTVSTED